MPSNITPQPFLSSATPAVISVLIYGRYLVKEYYMLLGLFKSNMLFSLYWLVQLDKLTFFFPS